MSFYQSNSDSVFRLPIWCVSATKLRGRSGWINTKQNGQTIILLQQHPSCGVKTCPLPRPCKSSGMHLRPQFRKPESEAARLNGLLAATLRRRQSCKDVFSDAIQLMCLLLAQLCTASAPGCTSAISGCCRIQTISVLLGPAGFRKPMARQVCLLAQVATQDLGFATQRASRKAVL